MKSANWERIQRIYHAALEIADDKRRAFLAEACGDDEQLRGEIESLLASNEEVGEFLNTPALEAVARSIADEQGPALAGGRIAHYQILSFLGAGGMGEVYLAQDTHLGRKLALKLLPLAFTADSDAVRRFEQEARAASALNHPNIITIYDIGQAGNLRFIAGEFIDGQTLRQRMLSPMKLMDALDLAIQVSSALATAHEAGILHRDIKPENIMVRHDGYVKVLDFGLAKLSRHLPSTRTALTAGESSIESLNSTDPGRLMGTPRYISPEQIRGHDADARSDIFSLGVVLYEMVAGHPPFDGATPGEVMAAIRLLDAPPLTRYQQPPPTELERIVARALAKEREDRYQAINDLMIDLKNLRLELEVEMKMKRAGQPNFDTNINPGINEGAAAEGPLPPIHSGAAKQALSGADSGGASGKLEPVGGAVPIDSAFYLVRPTDAEFHAAIARRDSVVLVKGARQVGKTSLLARGLEQARQAGARVVLTDFQNLSASYLQTIEKLMQTLAESFADQLGLDVPPDRIWNTQLSPGINFERYLRREVLTPDALPVVWGLDEVDRLFTCDYGSEVFGLFRSWHNKRALEPAGPWLRLTLAIAYATEAHLFITDLNQSPFNVGTRLSLEDFTLAQVAELNQRYGSPLRDPADLDRYFCLLGGHPYLVRRGLYEMTVHGLDLATLEIRADQDEGPFGDHLRRLYVSLAQDPALCEVVRGVLKGNPSVALESFYRLRSAGLMAGDSAQEVRPRCELYSRYLEKHLL